MTRIDVSLPEDLKAFAEAEATRTGHANVGEYVVDLLREAERRSAKLKLEAKLLGALDSPGREVTNQDWDAMDQRFEARHAQDRK
jgi:hypothetical protein